MRDVPERRSSVSAVLMSVGLLVGCATVAAPRSTDRRPTPEPEPVGVTFAFDWRHGLRFAMDVRHRRRMRGPGLFEPWQDVFVGEMRETVRATDEGLSIRWHSRTSTPEGESVFRVAPDGEWQGETDLEARADRVVASTPGIERPLPEELDFISRVGWAHDVTFWVGRAMAEGERVRPRLGALGRPSLQLLRIVDCPGPTVSPTTRCAELRCEQRWPGSSGPFQQSRITMGFYRGSTGGRRISPDGERWQTDLVVEVDTLVPHRLRRMHAVRVLVESDEGSGWMEEVHVDERRFTVVSSGE